MVIKFIIESRYQKKNIFVTKDAKMSNKKSLINVLFLLNKKKVILTNKKGIEKKRKKNEKLTDVCLHLTLRCVFPSLDC